MICKSCNAIKSKQSTFLLYWRRRSEESTIKNLCAIYLETSVLTIKMLKTGFTLLLKTNLKYLQYLKINSVLRLDVKWSILYFLNNLSSVHKFAFGMIVASGILHIHGEEMSLHNDRFVHLLYHHMHEMRWESKKFQQQDTNKSNLDYGF